MNTPFTSVARQRGASLIITLIMLVVIGLTAATAMKTATSNEKVVNNIRMQLTAQQYAEAALRYCEAQLVQISSNRVSTLQDANIPLTTSTTPNWAVTATWVGAATAKTVVTSSYIVSGNSAFAPSTRPECYAERQQFGTTTFTVVTARGFSPDYTTTLSSGITENGSVAWMQSTLALQ